MRHALSVIAILSVALPPVADAQVVRGRVLEQTTATPVSGAVVTLLDGEARRVASTLSSDEGRFAVTAPASGEYTLEVKRIGVRRVMTPPFSLAPGATLERDVEVATIPAVQPEVRVSGRSLCGTKLEEGPALAELWEDLRAALTAARVTQQERLLRVKTSVYSRTLDARGEKVIAEQRDEREGVTESPFRAVSPRKLSRSGYVDSLAPDAVIYYGPDATVLTSDEFVRDHCFKIVRGKGAERNWLGVAFEPVPRRSLPDVEGVLWLDPGTRELKRIDYSYTTHRGLNSRVDFGGRVEFARMPPGTWIVSRWWIRMPRLALVQGQMLPGVGRTKEPRVVGVQEDGGEVVTIANRGTTLRLGSQAAVLHGVVYDSTLLGPLPGAVVTVSGIARQATTDAAGRFRIPELAAGAYAVGVRHARADSLGAALPEASVRLAAGEEREVTLFLPSARTIVRTLCPDAANPDSTVLVRGRVRDAAGLPVASARIALSWDALSGPAHEGLTGKPTAVEAQSDSTGAFVLCGGKPDHPLTLRAWTAENNSSESRLRARAGQVTVRDMVLPRGGQASDAPPRSR
ncbi:MAG TPA: carboxypeptidase-like regulatory domain-containing protein [Gemmatimonadaceae bacterium]|jgi:hypothetical protein|nr:carboxypeptidase-like regulatory domain-containing protein [Gemmatimonadaceae bacterium]